MMRVPISTVDISRGSRAESSDSIASQMSSRVFVSTGRFSQAFMRPRRSLLRSKGSRRPSFFTTRRGISSTVS